MVDDMISMGISSCESQQNPSINIKTSGMFCKLINENILNYYF